MAPTGNEGFPDSTEDQRRIEEDRRRRNEGEREIAEAAREPPS